MSSQRLAPVPKSPASRFGRLALLACASSLAAAPLACGGATSAPSAAPAPASTRCAASDPDAPTDARARMEALKLEVTACFGMGTTPPKDGVVKVEVTVTRSGVVTRARAAAEGAEASALRCTEVALQKAKFAGFCGADVPISWTYALR